MWYENVCRVRTKAGVRLCGPTARELRVVVRSRVLTYPVAAQAAAARTILYRADLRKALNVATLKPVRVAFRTRTGERAWMVEIDPNVDLKNLLPDLVEALDLGGDPAAYELSVEGSVNEPVLVINARPGRAVGRATPIADND